MASIKLLTARSLNYALRRAGIEIRKAAGGSGLSDVEPWVAHIIEKTRPFTMTSDERISALCHAVRYIARFKIPGDTAECGVWHELTHLYPKLSVGGVLIIDDYGHWQGARQAVDEYFNNNGPRILLNRIDYTRRIGVKTELA
jgi:hypothetical protein